MKAIWKIFIFLILIIIIGSAGYFVYQKNSVKQQALYKTPEESDVYVRFGMEVYDKIVENYWNKGKPEDLAELYRLSLEKVSAKPLTLATTTRAGAASLLASVISGLDDAAKKKAVLDTGVVVLYNLAPQGRNGILSSKEEKDLRNTVSNIDPGKDLYKDLGLEKGASPSEIEKKFSALEKELNASTSPQAKAELEKISYAKNVLLDETKRDRYDTVGIEPTVFSQNLSNRTYYVYLSKISPTTLDEFGKAVYKTASSTSLNSLIIDVRGNVGGAVDFLQYFLGFFIGQGQYAFDFFHQENYTPYKTVMPKLAELSRFKKIVLLTDNMSQSTAELMAASFKKYNIGTVIGNTTRGWGTIENTYPISTVIDPSEKYSLLLVNSLTLRDDNQPIEGRGVDPHIKITDSDWKKQITELYESSDFAKTIIETVSKPPIK